MKKFTLILGVLCLMTVALSSCKKEWICTCTTGAASLDITIDKTTRADAKKQCDDLDIGSITDCSLK